jgi:hypothetical protein
VATASLGFTLQAAQVVNLGLGLAAASFPSIATEIAALQALVDAEIAKL